MNFQYQALIEPLEPSLFTVPATESWERPTNQPAVRAKRANREGFLVEPLEPSLFTVPALESWERPTNHPAIRSKRHNREGFSVEPLDPSVFTVLTPGTWMPPTNTPIVKGKRHNLQGLLVEPLEPSLFTVPPSESWERPTNQPLFKKRRHNLEGFLVKPLDPNGFTIPSPSAGKRLPIVVCQLPPEDFGDTPWTVGAEDAVLLLPRPIITNEAAAETTYPLTELPRDPRVRPRTRRVHEVARLNFHALRNRVDAMNAAATGPTGATGATGPAGADGVDGTTIPDGTTTGDLLVWNGTDWVALSASGVPDGYLLSRDSTATGFGLAWVAPCCGPGNNCSEAIAYGTIGVSKTGQIESGDQHWWYLGYLPAGSYRVRILSSSTPASCFASMLSKNTANDPSCPPDTLQASAYDAVLDGTPDPLVWGVSNRWFWVRVENGSGAPWTYEIIVE